MADRGSIPSTLTEEQAFLAAIHRGEDDAWGPYSDWLEERGDPSAELYRNRRITVGPDIELVTIPGGEFLMGSPDGEGYADEHPQHLVTVAPFRMGVYPVTQAQWLAVMGNNPSAFPGDDRRPVESVSWFDCQEFLAKLSESMGMTFRLPREEEWEYACRAGTTTRYYTGNDEAALGDAAWHYGNSGGITHPVGKKKPNAWGLYDTLGNVWEWCEDEYAADAYSKKSPQARAGCTGVGVGSTAGPTAGQHTVAGTRRHSGLSALASASRSASRVYRGGSWLYYETYCRAASRFRNDQAGSRSDLGLRITSS